MPFEENLDQFFSAADFGTLAQITRADGSVLSITGIFSSPSAGVEIYDQMIETDMPQLRCKSADLAGVKTKNLARVGAADYRVERIRDDRSGTTTLYLK